MTTCETTATPVTKAGGRPRGAPTYLGPKRGQAYCYVHDGDGRRMVYLGDYDSPASWRRFGEIAGAVQAGEVDRVEELRQVEAASVAAITIGEVVARFLVWADKEYRYDGVPSGEYGALVSACEPLKRLFADLPAHEFSPKKLARVRDAMVSKGWGRRSINRQVGRLRRVFKWAAQEELVPGSVLEGLRCLAPLKRGRTTAPESRGVPPVEESRVEATLVHLPERPAAIVRLLWLTGARPSEICAARTQDIDRCGENWFLRPARHKTLARGKEREIPLGPRALAILRPLLKLDRSAYLFDPEESEGRRRVDMHCRRKSKETPSQRERARRARENPRQVFRSHYTAEVLRRAVERACVAAKVDRWVPYQIRHAYATRVRLACGSGGAGLEAASVLLGHSDVETTKLYAERDREKAIQVAKRLG